MNNKYLTASTVTLFDAEIHPPPKGAVLLTLSKYNVLTKGTFQPGFHVAWGYLPKTPTSVKQRMADGFNHTTSPPQTNLWVLRSKKKYSIIHTYSKRYTLTRLWVSPSERETCLAGKITEGRWYLSCLDDYVIFSNRRCCKRQWYIRPNNRLRRTKDSRYHEKAV